MAKYCSDCTYLNPNDLKDGIKGFCKCPNAKGKYTLGNSPACDKFVEAHARKNWDREVIYNDAKNIPAKSSGTVGGSLFVAVVLIVIAIIVNLF